MGGLRGNRGWRTERYKGFLGEWWNIKRTAVRVAKLYEHIIKKPLNCTLYIGEVDGVQKVPLNKAIKKKQYGNRKQDTLLQKGICLIIFQEMKSIIRVERKMLNILLETQVNVYIHSPTVLSQESKTGCLRKVQYPVCRFWMPISIFNYLNCSSMTNIKKTHPLQKYQYQDRTSLSLKQSHTRGS